MAEICPVLLVTSLLYLCWLPSDDAEENESFGGTFSVKDYTSWLKKHRIQLFNYAVEVNETVVIWSPILPVPKGLHWSSLNMENELPASSNQKLGLAYSHYFDTFLKTYNKSWARVFTFDRQNRYLRIQQVNLGYADMFRLHVDENKKDNERKNISSKDQDFDVAITLMTYTSHECEFKGRPQSPKQGDTLIMSCSVVVNGLWNTSLVFRNTYDGSEIRGEVSKCNRQPSVGSRICSTVRVKAEVDILAYTCYLEFLPDQREDPKNYMFQNSKWTARFNKEVVCYLPKIYLEGTQKPVSSTINPTQPDKDQTMSPVTADKQPVEPDKEPVDPDKEPDEPAKEPAECHKESVEYDREVTEESQFSQKPRREVGHSEVTGAAEEEAEAGAPAGDTVDKTTATKDVVTPDPKVADPGCNKEVIPGYTSGEIIIDNLLRAFIISGCKAAKEGVAAEVTGSPACSLGEKQIIKLLQSFFTSDCKVGKSVKGTNAGKMDGPGYSDGQKEIIKLLSSYFSSGCKVNVTDVEDRLGPGNSDGEKHIINQLLSYFSVQCKDEFGKSHDDDDKSTQKPGTADRHVQSVALELFLLVFGVCLTRIEL